MKKTLFITIMIPFILCLCSCSNKETTTVVPDFYYGTITTSNSSDFCKISLFDENTNLQFNQEYRDYANVSGLNFCNASIYHGYLYFLYEGFYWTKTNDIIRVNLSTLKDEPLHLDRNNITSFVTDDNILYSTTNTDLMTIIDSYNMDTGEKKFFEVKDLVLMDLYPYHGSLYAISTNEEKPHLYQVDVSHQKLTSLLDLSPYLANETPTSSCIYKDNLYFVCDSKIIKWNPQSNQLEEIPLSTSDIYTVQQQDDVLYLLSSTDIDNALASSKLITFDLSSEKELCKASLPVCAIQFYISGDTLYCVTEDDCVCQLEKSNEEYKVIKNLTVATSDDEYTPILFH